MSDGRRRRRGARRARARPKDDLGNGRTRRSAQIAMGCDSPISPTKPLPLDRRGIADAVAIAFNRARRKRSDCCRARGRISRFGSAAERGGGIRTRAIAAISSADLSLWLIDQLAPATNRAERDKARALLAAAARDEAHSAGRAHLALFDARIARRRRQSRPRKVASPRELPNRFEAIGWPWERAAALEVAGLHAEARGDLSNDTVIVASCASWIPLGGAPATAPPATG